MGLTLQQVSLPTLESERIIHYIFVNFPDFRFPDTLTSLSDKNYLFIGRVLVL